MERGVSVARRRGASTRAVASQASTEATTMTIKVPIDPNQPADVGKGVAQWHHIHIRTTRS